MNSNRTAVELQQDADYSRRMSRADKAWLRAEANKPAGLRQQPNRKGG